jgi:diaminopimelate decarboxylase
MTEFKDGVLQIGGCAVTDLLEQFGSPLYVYDQACLEEQFQTLQQAIAYRPFQLRYACKANGNLTILRLLRAWGLHLDVVSPGEVILAERAGFAPHQLLYTGNSVTTEDLQFVGERAILINMDSLSELRRVGQRFSGRDVCLRINTDVGAGHHEHVITGGPDSKFGLGVNELAEARAIIGEFDLRVVGLHQHIGSGILEPEIFWLAMVPLLDVAKQFDGLEFLNLGGGLGIPYAPEDVPLDVQRLGEGISERFEDFCQAYGKRLRLELEPGRFLAASSGYLLTRVNTIKRTGKHVFAGTDSGFNHLIRHPLYGSYHKIVNATRSEGPMQTTIVCGNLCESGDLFTRGRDIVEAREGDILAICDAGAYGYAMSFPYNMRPRPPEVLISHGQPRLIRRRETLEDLFTLFPEE